jgi:hypothetical protein
METTMFIGPEQEGVTLSEQSMGEEQQSVAERSNTEYENRHDAAQKVSKEPQLCRRSVQHLVARYLDNSQHFGHHILELYEQASQWTKSTPWAPLFKSQYDFLRRWIDSSVNSARVLWQVESEQISAKKTEPDATA